MKNKVINISEEVFGKYYDKSYKKFIGEYHIREWNLGIREDIMEAASDIVVSDGEQQFKMKASMLKISTLMGCIIKAPFKTSKENLRELPPALADYFYEEISELNESFTVEELKKSVDSLRGTSERKQK